MMNLDIYVSHSIDGSNDKKITYVNAMDFDTS